MNDTDAYGFSRPRCKSEGHRIGSYPETSLVVKRERAIALLPTIQANLPILYFLAVAHCIMGLLAAGVAQRKGYPRGFWLIWGLIGGTVAFVTASRLKPKTDVF